MTDYKTITTVRAFILGDAANDSQDATFDRLGPMASVGIDGLISDVVDVPLTAEQFAKENVQTLVTIMIAQLYYQEKKDYHKDRDDKLESQRKIYLESVRKDLQTDPTDRAEGPLAETGSYDSPLIDEDYWNGTKGDSG